MKRRKETHVADSVVDVAAEGPRLRLAIARKTLHRLALVCHLTLTEHASVEVVGEFDEAALHRRERVHRQRRLQLQRSSPLCKCKN